MITVTIPGTPLAMFIVLGVIFLAAIGANRLCEAIIVAGRMYFEPEPSQEQAYDYPPPAQVQVVEIMPAQRAAEDLPTTSGPVMYGQAPIYDQIPMPMPPREDDLAVFDFWATPRWLAKTGAFPVIEAAEATPKARERFETAPPKRKAQPRKRKVTVQVGDETRSELVSVP